MTTASPATTALPARQAPRRTALIRAAVLVIGAAWALGATVHGAHGGTRTARDTESLAPHGMSAQMTHVCPPARPGTVTCFAQISADTAVANGPQGYGPADLAAAYGLPLSGGAGKTVAVVEAFHDPTLEADLGVYRATYGLPDCTVANGCLSVVNQNGAAAPLPQVDQGWAVEISLDVDMVSATCPDCKILVVEAASSDINDLVVAVDTAAAMGAAAISNSYGGPEFAGEQQFESHYNHPGRAVVASAGDNGYGATYPAASAYVTAVGGTTLTRTSTGWSESVWKGTGSGCSAYIAKPSWQHDPNCPMRMMNDIAAVADPNTEVAVYATTGRNGWVKGGGTSASAPIIAGAYALADTSRVADGRGPWLQHTSTNMRAITTGDNLPGLNATTCGGDYLCTATGGYSGPAGWGSLQGVDALVATAATVLHSNGIFITPRPIRFHGTFTGN